jgi:chorismate synthase
MLEYTTAGESHGQCLLAMIEGFPYGTPIELDPINAELARRQGGYGRGARMKMEKDQAEILTGLRKGETLGSPITLRIENRVKNTEDLNPITRPRPGHADLAGAMKYGTKDARGVSERASARETAARVAAGALANGFLKLFDIHVLGYLVALGGVGSDVRFDDPEEIRRQRDRSLFYTPDTKLDEKLKALVDEAKRAGDTLGGIFEVVAFHCPPGLGSHAGWREKFDGMLARALISVQTVKGVEIGLGFGSADLRGSDMHDVIVKEKEGKLGRTRNNAGGIEGGMTNGQPVVCRAACKPIASLLKPLNTVDLKSQEEKRAAYERSDVCVVSAASVIGEAVVSFEIARAFLQKFGADTYEETRARFEKYKTDLGKIES